MRVLFDHQAFSMQSHGGVSRCFAELYRYLPESVEAYISVKETDNVYCIYPYKKGEGNFPIIVVIKFPIPFPNPFKFLGKVHKINPLLTGITDDIKALNKAKYNAKKLILSTKGTNIEKTIAIDCRIKIANTLFFFSYPPVKEPIKPPKAIPIIGPITIDSIYTYNL